MKHSLETKTAVAKAVVDDGRTVAEVSEEYEVSHSLIYLWTKRYRNGESIEARRGKPTKKRTKPPEVTVERAPRTAIVSSSTTHELVALRAENARLKRKIQQLLGLVMEE